MNIDEIIFYLKLKYLAYNKERKIFINDIASEEPFFEAMIGGYLKNFSKSFKEDENMSLKNKCLIGGWILMAWKVCRLVILLVQNKKAGADKLYGKHNHEILLKYFNESERQTPWKHVFFCTFLDNQLSYKEILQ